METWFWFSFLMVIITFLFVGTSTTLYDYAYYVLSKVVSWVSIVMVCACIAGMLYCGIQSGNEELIVSLPLLVILIMPIASIAYEFGNKVSDNIFYYFKGY